MRENEKNNWQFHNFAEELKVEDKIFCEAKTSTTQYGKEGSQESCSIEQRVQFALFS